MTPLAELIDRLKRLSEDKNIAVVDLHNELREIAKELEAIAYRILP